MERFAKIFLILNIVSWIPYSLVCIFHPELLTILGVFDLDTWVEKTEVRAMYGGAQLAIGLLAVITLMNMKRHLQTTLLFYVLLFAGLAVVRAAGMVIDGPGLSFDPTGGTDPAAYNGSALWMFEVPMLVMALVLYRHFSRNE